MSKIKHVLISGNLEHINASLGDDDQVVQLVVHPISQLDRGPAGYTAVIQRLVDGPAEGSRFPRLADELAYGDDPQPLIGPGFPLIGPPGWEADHSTDDSVEVPDKPESNITDVRTDVPPAPGVANTPGNASAGPSPLSPSLSTASPGVTPAVK